MLSAPEGAGIPSYVELHCHSSFSFLDGASSPLELATRAAELGYPALALTDHDGLWGSMEFAVSCKGAGIKPITGAELTVSSEGRFFHLTLLVENATGYHNLCRLLTEAHSHTRDGPARKAGRPSVPLDALAGRAEGLICLSGCARLGAVASAWEEGDLARGERMARTLAGWFGPANFRIELQRPFWRHDRARNRWLAGLAGSLGLPAVTTGNVHAHEPERTRLQDALVAVRLGYSMEESEPGRRGNASSSLVSPQQMAARFSQYPEAVAESARIAERLEFDLERELGYRYPQAGDPDADSDLAELCRVRLGERYRGTPEAGEAAQRLANELKIIRGLGLSGFFLLHHDLLELARDVAVEVRGPESARAVLPPGRGRGSSVSSIVCYLSGLSHVDPVKAGLFPGRFLNEEVTTAPDIDLDFPRDIRAKLIPRIHQRYGADRSALVAAFPTYRSRGAIRDFGKVLGIPAAEIERAARAVDFQSGSDDLERDLATAIGRERAHSLGWKNLVWLTRQARGVPRNPSQHSGGMVISTKPLIEICPIVPAAMEERQIVQWDKDSCQDAGFLKIDLLGLGMLSAVERCVDEIGRIRGETVDLSRIDLADPPTFEAIRKGETTGVFQIESRAQMQMLPRMKPMDIDDLTIQVALVRPGPIQGGAVHPYIERRRRLREDPYYEVPYQHPLLKPVLEETLGVIIFQEQVIEVAMNVAGFSSSEAEGLRRAMSRKRSREALEAHHHRFMEGAVARGVPAAIAEDIYRQIIGFSGFGFPKAHSAAFGLLAYQSAWLKVHYGPEYLASLLNEQPMGFYPPDSLVQEGRRSGITVLPPDLNASRVDCSTEWPSEHDPGRPDAGAGPAPAGREPDPPGPGPAVRIGLAYIKGANQSEMERLVAERERGGPYRDLGDLAARMPLRRQELEQLAWAGALRSLPRGERVSGLWSVGLLPHHPASDGSRQLALPFEQTDPPELQEPESWNRVQAEYGTIGMTLEGHPMALARAQLPDTVLSTAEAQRLGDKSWTEVAGLQVARQRPETANGVIFILIEDEHGTLNLILPPRVATKHRLVVRTATLIKARGRIETNQGVVNLVVNSVVEVHPPNPEIKAVVPAGHSFGRRGR
ncbi:MAG: error-prone DNA polymerase [Thermoleophilia bacterium]|nr:error-prone DNA polymerase [Thermoleophilia bacterium]